MSLRHFLPALLLLAHFAPGQTPDKPAFDVAAVKANKSGEQRASSDILPNGHVTIHSATLRHLIMTAYRVEFDAIKGGPSWLDSDRYDVVAKSAPKTPEDDLRLMLRTLLVERWGLATHVEKRTMPVYALMAGKKAPEMAPSKDDSGEKGCKGNGVRRLTCHRMTMADLVKALPRYAAIDQPVVDETSLTGAYDFDLDWRGSAAVGTTGTLSILDAVRLQLGLRVETVKRASEVLVIDHAERVVGEN